MKVSSERIEGSQVVLTVEIEPAMLEKSLEKAYRRLANRNLIPGFRKGKVPRAVVERYLGRDALMEEALDRLVPEAYTQALEQETIDAVAPPQNVEITQTDPVAFKATVPIRPAIELGDYHQIRVDPEPVEVKDEEVEAMMERICLQQATWESVHRPVRFEDLVTLEVESHIEGRPYINEKGWQYYVQPGSQFPMTGFAEALEGLEKNGKKEIHLTFPADYVDQGLVGKEVLFKVLATEVKERRLPELNDDFAKSVGDGFDNLEALRSRVADDLKAKAEREIRNRLEEQVVEAVVGLAQLEYPQVLVEREIDHIIEEQAERLKGSALKLEDYLRSLKKTEEELRNDLRPQATVRVSRGLVLGKVAGGEKLEVTGDELEAEVESMAQNAEDKAEEVRKFFSSEAAQSSLHNMLLTRKTLQRLVDIATGAAEAESETGPATEGETEPLAEVATEGAVSTSTEQT